MPARVVDLRSRAQRDPLPKLLAYGDNLADMPRDQLRSYLAGCTPERRRIAEYALGAAGVHWRADPATMLEHLSPSFERHRVAELLGKAFRRAADGVEPRQIWELPARYGKSELGSKGGPAWCLDRDPTATIILCSFAHNLAVENAIGARDLIRNNPADLRVRLRADRNRNDRWKTTKGGGLLAAGIGGTIAGFGAAGGVLGAGGGIIFDDPFKNWAEAHSANRRELVWNFYLSVLRLRLDYEGGFIIIITTRWHEDDIVGRALAAQAAGDGDTWTRYRLPAIAEDENDLLGRAIGEPLIPSRFPLDAVLARHKALGPYLTAAMEQQRPAPEEGGELKRSWWMFGQLPTGTPDDAVTSWDMKLKDRANSGDYVVGQAWARYGGTAWGVAQLRGQWNFATTCAAVALMAVRYPWITRHVVENAGNGPEVIEALRRPHESYTVPDEVAGQLGMTPDERAKVEALRQRGMSGIVSNNVGSQGDKTVRARLVSPYLQAGDVWVDEQAVNGWGLQLVNEAAAFPNGENDDQVDAWSQAMRFLLAIGQGDIELPEQGRIQRPPVGHVQPIRGHIGGARPRQ